MEKLIKINNEYSMLTRQITQATAEGKKTPLRVRLMQKWLRIRRYWVFLTHLVQLIQIHDMAIAQLQEQYQVLLEGSNRQVRRRWERVVAEKHPGGRNDNSKAQ